MGLDGTIKPIVLQKQATVLHSHQTAASKKQGVGGTSPLKRCWEYALRASVGVSLCLCCSEVTALHSHKCLTLWGGGARQPTARCCFNANLAAAETNRWRMWFVCRPSCVSKKLKEHIWSTVVLKDLKRIFSVLSFFLFFNGQKQGSSLSQRHSPLLAVFTCLCVSVCVCARAPLQVIDRCIDTAVVRSSLMFNGWRW